MNRQWQGGASTVPWLIGLAMVAVLSVVAYVYVLPGYRDYLVQSKVSEVFVSLDACRAEVSQVVQHSTAPTLSTALFGCDGGASSGVKISPHLKSIAVNSAAAITVTLDYRSLTELTPTGNTLTLVPLVDATTPFGTRDVRKPIFAWRCGSPRDGTTIPDKYLPSRCRS